MSTRAPGLKCAETEDKCAEAEELFTFIRVMRQREQGQGKKARKARKRRKLDGAHLGVGAGWAEASVDGMGDGGAMGGPWGSGGGCTWRPGEGLRAPRRPPRVASHARTHGSRAQAIKRRSGRPMPRHQGSSKVVLPPSPVQLPPCLAHPFSPLPSAPPAPSLAPPPRPTLGLSLPAPLLLWLVLPWAHHWA